MPLIRSTGAPPAPAPLGVETLCGVLCYNLLWHAKRYEACVKNCTKGMTRGAPMQPTQQNFMFGVWGGVPAVRGPWIGVPAIGQNPEGNPYPAAAFVEPPYLPVRGVRIPPRVPFQNPKKPKFHGVPVPLPVPPAFHSQRAPIWQSSPSAVRPNPPSHLGNCSPAELNAGCKAHHLPFPPHVACGCPPVTSGGFFKTCEITCQGAPNYSACVDLCQSTKESVSVPPPHGGAPPRLPPLATPTPGRMPRPTSSAAPGPSPAPALTQAARVNPLTAAAARAGGNGGVPIPGPSIGTCSEIAVHPRKGSNVYGGYLTHTIGVRAYFRPDATVVPKNGAQHPGYGTAKLEVGGRTYYGYLTSAAPNPFGAKYNVIFFVIDQPPPQPNAPAKITYQVQGGKGIATLNCPVSAWDTTTRGGGCDFFPADKWGPAQVCCNQTGDNYEDDECVDIPFTRSAPMQPQRATSNPAARRATAPSSALPPAPTRPSGPTQLRRVALPPGPARPVPPQPPVAIPRPRAPVPPTVSKRCNLGNAKCPPGYTHYWDESDLADPGSCVLTAFGAEWHEVDPTC